MSELPFSSLPEDPINPGDVINELVIFEDIIADAINPSLDKVQWTARASIGELIRPNVQGHPFSGRITDITLMAMDDPYARLLDAPVRGLKGIKRGGQLGTSNELSSEYSLSLASEYRGFILKANARSSGRGVIGMIQSELWYAPVLPQFIRAGSVVQRRRVTESGVVQITRFEHKLDHIYRTNADDLGRVIKRWVSKPEYDPDRFVELSEASRAIGLAVLRKALQHPISTPMRD